MKTILEISILSITFFLVYIDVTANEIEQMVPIDCRIVLDDIFLKNIRLFFRENRGSEKYEESNFGNFNFVNQLFSFFLRNHKGDRTKRW